MDKELFFCKVLFFLFFYYFNLKIIDKNNDYYLDAWIV